MKNIMAMLALVCVMSVCASAQGESTSKKAKGGTPAAPTTPAPSTGGAAVSSEGKKSKGATPATPATPAKPAASGKMMKGNVVDITAWLSGGNGKVNKDQATQAVSGGHILGLMIGSKVYLVSNADGSSASSKLAGFANGTVGVKGTTKSKGGYNMIIATIMENV